MNMGSAKSPPNKAGTAMVYLIMAETLAIRLLGSPAV